MYIDRWYVGLFMLLKAKWVFLLYGSPCIQIMGGLINLHTKHPFMTKSEFAWAKAMHTCTGRHIKTCDRVNLSDNFLLALLPVSHISKLILDSMFKSRQTMWGKWWELLWSRFVSRRTTKRPLRASDWQIPLVQFGQISQVKIPTWRAKAFWIEWVGEWWGGTAWKAASIISFLILMLSVLNKLTARFHIW